MVGIKTRATCPKCGQSFDYEFIPGGSLTAIRLGKYRYMRCQKCGKWALFNLMQSLSPVQVRNLVNSSIIVGIALAILGGALLAFSIGRHILALHVIGIAVLVLAVFMLGYSFSLRVKKPKANA